MEKTRTNDCDKHRAAPARTVAAASNLSRTPNHIQLLLAQHTTDLHLIHCAISMNDSLNRTLPSSRVRMIHKTRHMPLPTDPSPPCWSTGGIHMCTLAPAPRTGCQTPAGCQIGTAVARLSDEQRSEDHEVMVLFRDHRTSDGWLQHFAEDTTGLKGFEEVNVGTSHSNRMMDETNEFWSYALIVLIYLVGWYFVWIFLKIFSVVH